MEGMLFAQVRKEIGYPLNPLHTSLLDQRGRERKETASWLDAVQIKHLDDRMIKQTTNKLCIIYLLIKWTLW